MSICPFRTEIPRNRAEATYWKALQLRLHLTHYDLNTNLCTSNRTVSSDKYKTAVNMAAISTANKINYIYLVWEIVAAKLDTFTCQLRIIGIVCLGGRRPAGRVTHYIWLLQQTAIIQNCNGTNEKG